MNDALQFYENEKKKNFYLSFINFSLKTLLTIIVSKIASRQLNKNLVRVFKKIILIEDFLEKRIENFEILSEYEDYLIVKYKADIEEFYLYYNKDFYELINQNI